MLKVVVPGKQVNGTHIFFLFSNHSASGKTAIWITTAKDGDIVLGRVTWHAPWRKYIFEPVSNYSTVYEQTCLREIAEFVEQLTKDHKEGTAHA